MSCSWRGFLIASFGCAALLASGPCPAQSFDCAKAKSGIEKRICGDPDSDLREIDSEMGDAYNTLLGVTPADAKDNVREAQRLWLRKRGNECAVPDAETEFGCLKQITRHREEELEDQLRRRLGLSPTAYKWIRAYAYLTVKDVPGYAADIKNRFGQCTSLPRALSPKLSSLVPKGYESLFSIATHRCDAVLRIYLLCPSSDDDWMVSCREMLIFEDAKSGQAGSLGELQSESTGNAGGIFIPMAFTSDDRHIILQVWMGDPGAGGGMVNYGYHVIARSGKTGKRSPLAPADTDFYYRPDAAHPDEEKWSRSKTLFYDDFGKVVYTVNSPKLPLFSLPGPQSNSGRLMVKDLTTLKERIVLEKKDTTFEVLTVDEKNRTLKLRATRHRFTTDCPREEDALICSKKTFEEFQIPLP